MIDRVEIQFEEIEDAFKISSVILIDSNGEKNSTNDDFWVNRRFNSKVEIAEFVASKLKIEQDVIDLKGPNLIKMDEDTEKEEKSANGTVYPYEVDIREEKMSIYEWLRKLDRGLIKLDPEFQRNLLWSNGQKSRFIESILTNIPIPPLFVNQDIEGAYIIVDGLQRTTTLRDYLKGAFKLQELHLLQNFLGKKFDELDKKFQVLIEDKQLFLYVIKPKVPMKIVYEIFNRINTGGTQLNRQEIRNCLYPGKATELLKRLSGEEYFKKAIDMGISPKRMKDREAILRCLAFHIFNYKHDYKGDMDQFLVDAMKGINNMSETNLSILENSFEQTMKLTYDFFGQANFRMPSDKWKGRINIAIMESIVFFFSSNDEKLLIENKEKIIENFRILLKDEEFLSAVSSSTSTKKNVETRFDKVFEILGGKSC
ncbi:MAG: DUF262 domain-containing protein [Candidatus Omnitrophota bacterium]